MKTTNLPKTTVFDHIQDVSLSIKAKQRIKEEATRRIVEFNRKRKGKCMPGRIVIKPKNWTNELIFLVTHFMFDGEITGHSCIYNNRSGVLIDQVRFSMKKVFNLEPKNWINKKTGVYRISYHYVELAIYTRKKVKELMKNIIRNSLVRKKIFLQAFFDDEGSIHFKKRLVRGFQHNLKVLKLVQKLLKDFKIESKIDKKYQEIIISRKENIIKFRNKINFSKGIYINPNRKNSIWKRKLEKREILNKIIDSYQK